MGISEKDLLEKGEKLSEAELAGFFEAAAQANEELCFNGINGATGTYAVAPRSGQQLASLIRGEKPPEEADLLLAKKASQFPIKPPNDPARLDHAGWAVI